MDRRQLLAGMAAIGGTVLAAQTARAQAGAIRLAHGLGILYLPLIVMRERRLLEGQLARAGLKAEVSWQVLDGAGPINDAILAGALDIAGNSVPGFLTIWSKARGIPRAEVTGLAGLSRCALLLNTNRPEIRSLADFRQSDRIAVPSAKVSLQAVILQMAAAKQFGQADWARLDSMTMSLAHPDAVAALLSGRTEVAAHFASPPFSVIEGRDPRIHAVINSVDVVGDITLDMVFGAKRFTDANPGLVACYLAAQEEANVLIRDNPTDAAAAFAQNSRAKVDPHEVVAMLADPQTVFETTPRGVMQYVAFMQRADTIRTVPTAWAELFVPQLRDREGS
jgi:NitT/TauT family transport system substrate-binding protein